MRRVLVVDIRRWAFDVYIGRPSKWGNPFIIGRDGTREVVVDKYRTWVLSQPALWDALDELDGKVLGCWCAPLLCHGDVLLELLKQKRAGVSREALLQAPRPVQGLGVF